MRESVIYQEWRAEALKEGRQEGLQQGLLQLTLRQLRCKFGSLSSEVESQIRALPLNQLENLAVTLLDFTTEADLLAWLADHPAD